MNSASPNSSGSNSESVNGSPREAEQGSDTMPMFLSSPPLGQANDSRRDSISTRESIDNADEEISIESLRLKLAQVKADLRSEKVKNVGLERSLAKQKAHVGAVNSGHANPRLHMRQHPFLSSPPMNSEQFISSSAIRKKGSVEALTEGRPSITRRGKSHETDRIPSRTVSANMSLAQDHGAVAKGLHLPLRSTSSTYNGLAPNNSTSNPASPSSASSLMHDPFSEAALRHSTSPAGLLKVNGFPSLQSPSSRVILELQAEVDQLKVSLENARAEVRATAKNISNLTREKEDAREMVDRMRRERESTISMLTRKERMLSEFQHRLEVSDSSKQSQLSTIKSLETLISEKDSKVQESDREYTLLQTSFKDLASSWKNELATVRAELARREKAEASCAQSLNEHSDEIKTAMTAWRDLRLSHANLDEEFSMKLIEDIGKLRSEMAERAEADRSAFEEVEATSAELRRLKRLMREYGSKSDDEQKVGTSSNIALNLENT